MNVLNVKIKGVHTGVFRSGDWADVVGLVILPRPDGEQRLCYMVRFPDGAVDYWAVKESSNYEFKAAT